MNASAFDPDIFMSAQTEGAMETEYAPCPVGDYMAQITAISVRPTEKNGQAYYPMDISWKVDSPDNEEANGRLVRQTIFLDVSPNGGLAIGKNKNVALGRLRDAVGQNGPQAWSPNNLVGAAAMIRIKHRIGEGDYEGRTFDEVDKVAKSF